MLFLHSCSAERGLAWGAVSAWWNVVRSEGFSFLRRKAASSLTVLKDSGISHCLHSFDSFPDFDFALALVKKTELSAPSFFVYPVSQPRISSNKFKFPRACTWL